MTVPNILDLDQAQDIQPNLVPKCGQQPSLAETSYEYNDI